jgi:hypothetical protein
MLRASCIYDYLPPTVQSIKHKAFAINHQNGIQVQNLDEQGFKASFSQPIANGRAEEVLWQTGAKKR